MTLAAILRNATFTDRPETRSGEELYWHSLAGQYVALPSVSASADEQLRRHGYQPVRPDQAKSAQFDALTALRRLWPDLHKPHPDLIAHHLTGETCRVLISLQPVEDRGRMGRWLMARCKALGKNDVATSVGKYMATADVRAAHPWATGRGQSNQFLLSQSLGSAFILTGGEATGYTLHTFVTGDSAPRQRNGETIRDILTPNAEWSNTDWEHYDALLTAKPASESEFWDHPALLKFLGVRNKIIEPGSGSWAARVRSNGAGALLGERHAALQKRFLNAIPASWLDHMADDLGLRLNNQAAYRLLTDCWMALRTSDAECISHIVPAIRETHSDAFADYTDNQLLSLWRSSFQPITDHIRQASTGKKNAELIRTSQAYADMSPATMRDVLSAHYGAPAINALVNAGKLHLLANHQGLPMDIRLRSSSNLSNIAGATTPDNTVYLIGNRITPQTLPGLFLHEVGEHAALANMLGPDYGRMSKHFQKLLRDKDTYATWAAMRVPSSTRPEHVASEQLAYLVERVANDENARPGGQGGYTLGQECLANLRTWLFRTPLCRWLDEIGALDDFTLRPQDMASLAREAVDFFVDQVKPGTVTKNQNTWIDALNPATLDTLYRSAPQARIQELEKLGAEQALGYLYALAMTRAPLIDTAIDHFSATLATLASGAEKPELQAVAGELLVLQQSMDTQAQLKAQVDRAGFAMWIDGTSDPEDARLHFLTPSPKNPGMWQLNHYRKGIGAYSDDQYDSVEVALDQAQPASFMVSEAEAATVLQEWAAITGQNQQTRSQSFNRWFGASQAADSAGNARVLYHGTGKDFTAFKGLTIWASTSPALANEYADYRGAWEEGSASIMPVYMQAERPFDADKLETTVTLKSFFEEAAAQANAAGRTFDAEQAVVLLNHIKGCSRREESGPYYRAHDIWNEAQSMFGSDGAESVKSLMKLLGFDSIKMTEQDQVTFGVFEPGQVKSAIGNRGSFDANNADIRFKGNNLADTPVFVDPVAALKRWAGNTKVVNENGLPKVVFHGTGADILRFDPAMIGEGADWNKSGTDAFWFSSSETVSETFAKLTDSPAIMPVFLKLENPLVVDSEQWARRFDTLGEGFKFGEGRISYDIKWFKREAIAQARAEGRDGVIFLKGYDGPPVEGSINYAVFEPSQIKSAIGNRGTYDRASDDIRLKVTAPTETPAFTRWFDDSKVVGADGKPLVVYHGTKADFSEFDPAKIGASDEGLAGKGFYFTYNPEEASSYAMRDNFGSGDAPNVLPAYVSIRNPLVITHGVLPDGRKVQDLHGGIGINANGGAAVRKLAEDGDHDGVMWVSLDGAVRHVMAFRAEQIKSAIGNNGNFDSANPDIRFSVNSIAADSSTKTSPLKEWFGDSKVVDAEGEPLVLYRGVVAANLSDGMLNAEPRPGYAVFASSSPHVAASYANPDLLEGEVGALVPIYVKANDLVEFPVRIDKWGHRQFSKTGFDEAARRLLPGQVLVARKVYDIGPRAREDIDPKRLYSYGHDLYAFGQGTSVKSAIGNIGTFAPANADIRSKSNEPSDSPAFKAWFDQSKVVDGSGKPLVVYHGSRADILSFDPAMAPETRAKGMFFSPDKGTASAFAIGDGGNVAPVYLSMQNPLEFEFNAAQYASPYYEKMMMDEAVRAGHDGMVITSPGRQTMYVAFYPEQIKSAIGNNGDFDPNNADIRYSLADDATASQIAREKQVSLRERARPQSDKPATIGSAAIDRFNQARDKASHLLAEGGYSNFYAWMSPQAVMDDYATAVTMMRFGRDTSDGFKELFNELDAAYEQLMRHAPELIDVFPDNGPIPTTEDQEAAPDLAVVIPLTQPPETLKQAVEVRSTGDGRWYLVDRHGEWGTFAHPSKAKAEAALAKLGATSDSADYSLVDYSAISAKDAKRLMADAGDNLMNVMLTIKKARPDLKPAVDDAFTSIAYFYEDAPGLLGVMAKVAIKKNEGAAEKQSIMARTGGDLAGLQLASKDGKQFAFFLPDASEPGRFRASLFDERGFFGHSTRDSYAELLDEAFTDGYRTEVAGKLESMAGTETFADGNDLVAKVQAVNAGRMSWKELVDGQKAKEAAVTSLNKLPETPAFGKWFGDSKVVDAKGEPLVVYHGTAADFTQFEAQRFGQNFKGNPDTGFYFTNNAGDRYSEDTSASGYATHVAGLTGQGGANVMPVYLSIKNPLVIEEDMSSVGGAIAYADTFRRDIRRWIDSSEFDGIIIRDLSSELESLNDGPETVYIAFRPEQIKSAIGNAGTYDPDNADIRFSFAGENAQTANRDLLTQAQERITAGEDAEIVRRETGWFQGHDQGWRFELDDSKAAIPDHWYQDGEVNGFPVKRMDGCLGDHVVDLHPVAAASLGKSSAKVTGILNHQELFAAYPQLSTINVVLEQSEGYSFAENGVFRRDTVNGQPYDSILIRYNPARGGNGLSALLHEVQHAIQKVEGFARGGSTSEFNAEQLISQELNSINQRTNQLLEQNPETATVYRACVRLRIKANDAGWPEQMMANVAALEAELVEMPGGEELFDLETERFGIQFIDKIALPFEKYRQLAGEVEARNVQTRLGFDAQMRLDIAPLSTEDVAPDHVNVQPNSGRVLTMALQQEQAERDSAAESALDMSREARLARAQAMGFDTSKVWYHGSNKAGFKAFDTDGKRNSKISKTGAFFAAEKSMAKSYGGSWDDAPLHSGAEMFADAQLLDGLEIERYWALIDSQGRVSDHVSRDDYSSAAQWLEDDGIELDEGESVEERFTLYYDDFHEDLITQAEAIAALDGLQPSQPGIYSVFLRTEDVLEIDWEGRNWDQGPTEKVWRLLDADGEVIDHLYNQEDAAKARAENPGSTTELDDQPIYENTDSAARQARDCGYDAVLIRNVQDTGQYSQHEEGDIIVVFDPADIRSTDAAFDPAHTTSGNLLFSITEAPQSPVFDQWFDGSQVCNDDGTPLVVYRGEHARSSDAVFQSRLGSLSFGDYETASLYATQPNNLSDSPINPRIIPAYLAIKRPLVVSDDPFVDFSLLIETLGFERAAVIATDLAGYIRNTQAWADLNSSLPVGDYITKHPEALASLYVELYPILDDPKYVDWLKAAGFDGAIYGGSGASFDKTEYRVFDPAQVASGAPMPVTPNAPSSSTRMALTQPAPSTPRFIGSPVSGEQFTLEYYGIGIPGQYGYGLYLPDAKAVGERAGNNEAINQYAGAALTPATIRKLRTDEATPVALRRLFTSFGKELAGGDDAQALLQAHIRTLQNSLADIELDQLALERGESDLLSAAYYAEMERQVKAELGTLINHMPKFEHVRPSSSLPSPADYLSWDAPLADQPDEIRDALAMIGVDGYWEVQSEQGAVGFMSKIEADAHYARLSNEGGKPSLVDQFEPGHLGVPSGGDIYRELSELLGSAQEASARLRGAGIKGIRYLPAPSPTGDASERYVIFSSPQPRKQPAMLPDLAEQKGIDQPVYPMAFSKLPAVVLNGQIDAIAHDLQEARTLMTKTLECKIDDLEDRHHWLSNLPNVDGQLFELNKTALFQARNELQQLNRWHSPDTDNCLSWSSPLSDEACNRLAPLIRVSPAEQITGEVVFHLLAERIGSNKAATDALMKTGFVGAYTEQGVAMWDAASRCLSQKISASHDRNRYHLVAHGSKHLIDSFSSEKIGTGEGVQAFGYGLYFADRKMVAAHYQKMRVREGCWYERTLYDTPSEMVHEVTQGLARAAVSEDMLQAAKHCLSIATWAPQRVDDVIQQYPSEHHQPIREILNGYSKVSSDQLTSFFLMPQKGVRGLNEIMEHDDRDYSMGLSYLGSGLHFYVREDMDDLKISQALTDHIRRQCDVEQAIEARNQVLLDLERKPHDDYFQSRLRDCDYFLNMAKCAQKTLDAYGPFSLERPLGNGNLYLVDLAINPSEYLRYDLPFSQQSTCVQRALHAITTEPALSESKQQALIKAIAENQMGHDLLGSIAGRGNYYDAACSENEILASNLLLARDVQGIKYPDGLSREAGGGSFNYVVFNDERIQILGHSDKHLRSESDEIPLYEWADTELLDKAQRLSM